MLYLRAPAELLFPRQYFATDVPVEEDQFTIDVERSPHLRAAVMRSPEEFPPDDCPASFSGRVTKIILRRNGTQRSLSYAAIRTGFERIFAS
jgi:hypothetical protein